MSKSSAGRPVVNAREPAERQGGQGDRAVDPWNTATSDLRELDLAEFPGALLMRVASIVQQSSTADYARRHGLSVPEWRILGRLHESAPIRLSVLCRIAYFDKAQAGRVLRGLEARGFVRLYPHSAHRLRRIVDITPQGRALAQEIFPEARAEQLKLLNTLSAEERRVTFTVLKKLLAVYGDEIPLPADRYRERED